MFNCAYHFGPPHEKVKKTYYMSVRGLGDSSINVFQGSKVNYIVRYCIEQTALLMGIIYDLKLNIRENQQKT